MSPTSATSPRFRGYLTLRHRLLDAQGPTSREQSGIVCKTIPNSPLRSSTNFALKLFSEVVRYKHTTPRPPPYPLAGAGESREDGRLRARPGKGKMRGGGERSERDDTWSSTGTGLQT